MDLVGATVTAKFEFYKDNPREFRFRLLAGNGDTLLSSDVYTSKLGCTKGIESVRTHSANPDNFVKESTANSHHRFSLISSNGRVLGTSQNYATLAAYNQGIANVARQARGASVSDLTRLTKSRPA